MLNKKIITRYKIANSILLIVVILLIILLIYQNQLNNKKTLPITSQRKSYTIDELCFSELTKIYDKDDFYDGKEITYNNHKYKVEDTKDGRRRFIPLNNAPEIELIKTNEDNCINLAKSNENKENITINKNTAESFDYIPSKNTGSSAQKNEEKFSVVIPFTKKVVYCEKSHYDAIKQIINTLEENERQAKQISDDNVKCLMACDDKLNSCNKIEDNLEAISCIKEADNCIKRCKTEFETRFDFVKKDAEKKYGGV